MMLPPNVTGSFTYGSCLNLYITGHSYTFLQKLNMNVLWQPGTDHAGIATEIIVEKQLIKEKKDQKRNW